MENLNTDDDDDDEMFDDFYEKLNDIVKTYFSLDLQISKPKVGRKIIKSFPKRFRPKVIAIEESKKF